jgi:hypothetical protein
MKTVMAVCGAAAMAVGCLAPKQAAAGNDSPAVLAGALVGTSIASAAAPAPRMRHAESVDPACYWTRGRPTWDINKGIWTRPRIQVCE